MKIIHTLNMRWQPAALVTCDIIVLKITLAMSAILRSADYANGARDKFGLVEQTFPLWLWAIATFSTGALILTGISWQRHFVVWLGHSCGAVVYTLLAVVQIAASFEEWPPEISQVTHAIPEVLWALMCTVMMLVVTTGALNSAKHEYALASKIAALAAIVVSSVTVAFTVAPADGIRGVGPLSILALTHCILMMRSGPRPLDEGETVEVEGVAAQKGV